MASWPDELRGVEPEIDAIYLNTENDQLYCLQADWPEYDPSTPYLDTEYAYIIKVACVAITNGEYEWLRENKSDDAEPFIGFDFAGWIVSAPKGARWKSGTQVYGFTNRRRGAGNARTYTRALLTEVWEKPFRLSFEIAATVPMSALTAFHALFYSTTGNPSDAVLVVPPHISAFGPNSKHKPRANGARRILVIGGGGAVGGMVVQLAALAGAGLIAATCSRKNMAAVQRLGAYTVIAYDQENNHESHLARYRHYFHSVIDCVGGEALREAWPCVRRGGKIFSIVDNPLEFTPEWSQVAHDVKSAYFVIKPNPWHLQLISTLIAEGLLQPIFSPENVLEFHQYNEINDRLVSKERGKLVLRINNEEPWDVIDILNQFGTVPALPRPEVAPSRRPRGLTTEEILSKYTGNKARYKEAKRNRKRIKNRLTGNGEEDAAAGGGDAGEELESEEESEEESEGAEGQEEPVGVDEDALLPNPWEVKPREPRGEEQDESSDEPPAPELAETSVGLGIQESAYGRPEPVWFSHQAANEMRRKRAEEAAVALFKSMETEKAAVRAKEAEYLGQLERAFLDSLPAHATKVDRARVRDYILRIKLYGEQSVFEDQSGPSRRREDSKVGYSRESDNAYELEIYHSKVKGKQRADFIDYGYQVVELSPEKRQQQEEEEEDGEQDDADDAISSFENKQIIGIKRRAEDNLDVTDEDIENLEFLVRKKLTASQRRSPLATELTLDMEDIPDPMEVDSDESKVGDDGLRMQLSSRLNSAMAAGLAKGLQEGAACLGSDMAEVQRATSTLTSALASSPLNKAPLSMKNDAVSLGYELPKLRPGQAKPGTLVPSPLADKKALLLDVYSDAQLLARRNRTLVDTIENISMKRLPKLRPPKKPKFGKLSEAAITLTLAPTSDGSMEYKKKSELVKSMPIKDKTGQSPTPSPQKSPPWGPDDDRILAEALRAELGEGKEKARRPPVPVPV